MMYPPKSFSSSSTYCSAYTAGRDLDLSYVSAANTAGVMDSVSYKNIIITDSWNIDGLDCEFLGARVS